MQDVNNDMDDLLRDAAENYPLRTEGADWDKVLAGLEGADAPIAAIINNKPKRKKRAFWLMWLLPLGLLCIPLYHGYKTKNHSSITKKNREQNTTVKTKGFLKNEDHNRIINRNNQVQRLDAGGNKIMASSVRIIKKKDLNFNSFSLATATKETAATSNGINGINNEIASSDNKNKDTEKQPLNALQRIEKIAPEENKTSTALQQKAITNDSVMANKSDSTFAKNIENENKVNKKEKAASQRQQGFYAGLSASLDVSTIKLQRVNKGGYSMNVMAGYLFSKHFSVESGINVSKKNYYSSGKYFDKAKTGIPQQEQIYFTNGSCNMFEIPLNVKYDFNLQKKHNLFVTAGLSSYIMKNEAYSYRADYMGWVYDTTRSYHHSGNNWLSVANFSIGYQLHINKQNSLRIEPYLKIPLKGFGIANMPITSTGITVNFTRSF